MSQKVRQMSTNATICNCFSIKLAAPNASAVWAKLQKFGKRESTVWRTWRLNYSEEFAIFAITPLAPLFSHGKVFKKWSALQSQCQLCLAQSKVLVFVATLQFTIPPAWCNNDIERATIASWFLARNFFAAYSLKITKKDHTLQKWYLSIWWFSNSVLPEFAFLVSTVYAMLPCCDSVWLP